MFNLIVDTLAIFGASAILLKCKKLIGQLNTQNNSNYVVSDFLVPNQKLKSIISEIFLMHNEYNHTKTQEFLDGILTELKSYNQNQLEIKEAWKADKSSWHETHSWYKVWRHFLRLKTSASHKI